MTQNEVNCVVHYQQNEDSPILAKFLLMVGVIWVLSVFVIIAI